MGSCWYSEDQVATAEGPGAGSPWGLWRVATGASLALGFVLLSLPFLSDTHSLSLTLSPGGCAGEVAHLSLSLPLIGAEILI